MRGQESLPQARWFAFVFGLGVAFVVDLVGTQCVGCAFGKCKEAQGVTFSQRVGRGRAPATRIATGVCLLRYATIPALFRVR